MTNFFINEIAMLRKEKAEAIEALKEIEGLFKGCAYWPRPMLMDYIDKIKTISGDVLSKLSLGEGKV